MSKNKYVNLQLKYCTLLPTFVCLNTWSLFLDISLCALLISRPITLCISTQQFRQHWVLQQLAWANDVAQHFPHRPRPWCQSLSVQKQQPCTVSLQPVLIPGLISRNARFRRTSITVQVYIKIKANYTIGRTRPRSTITQLLSRRLRIILGYLQCGETRRPCIYTQTRARTDSYLRYQYR